jgi:HlyD family secretion protein
MKLLRRFLIIAVVLGLAGWAVSWAGADYFANRNRINYRTAKSVRRTISAVVNSTGEVKPVLSVSIGSFVSGPITDLYVGFNDHVTDGQLMAKIDPRIYQAAVDGAKAAWVTRVADVVRVKALLQQAVNDEKRSVALRKQNRDYISQAEIDRFHFQRVQLEAQLEVADAAVEQAEAQLKNAQANLDYTEITSPVDGIVINRKIEPGQTLAAQFTTPELFIVAPEMDKRMHVYASVDEADIGLIRRAQEEKRPVEFTVDAYPEDLFTGEIEQVRMASTVTQNVVTYPVIVAAPNPELKLLPGMTAELSFQIEKKDDILCVPNAALRFYPDLEQVREEDKKILEGAEEEAREEEETADLSARELADAGEKRSRRHVWVVEKDNKLRAIPIVMGISDSRYTEVESGELEAGQALVTGIRPPT